MQQKIKRVYGSVKNKAVMASMLALSAGSALAEDPATPEAAVAAGKTAVLALLVIGGGALVAIALGGVGWAVGAKFVKKLKGAA